MADMQEINSPQQIAAFARREAVLGFWERIASEQPLVSIDLAKGTSVQGNIMGPCDSDTCLFVRNLLTPLGSIKEAKLRVVDVVAIEFPAIYSVPEGIQDLFQKTNRATV